MKLIIAGSRSLSVSPETISKYVNELLCEMKKEHLFEQDISVTEVVSGTARGIDLSGEEWAKEQNIPITRFPAKWELFGKSAGYKRNTEMAEYADALLAIYDGTSKGTKHMINLAEKKGLKIVVKYHIY